MIIKIKEGVHSLEEYPYIKIVMPTSKRKVVQKAPGQLVSNLVYGGKRFYLLIANCIAAEEAKESKGGNDEWHRMFYLLDHELRVVC